MALPENGFAILYVKMRASSTSVHHVVIYVIDNEIEPLLDSG